MRKIGLSLSLILGFVIFSFAQRDTIAAWTFPTGLEDDKYANIGTEQNLGEKYLSAEDTTSAQRELTYTNGVEGSGDFAATANGRDNGANAKYWAIKIKAQEYSEIRVSSQQRAANNPAGPEDFKLQYKIGENGTWTDIPGGDIIVANDWTTGVVSKLDLPSETNETSSSIHIRWIMTSNENIEGHDVDTLANAKIDNIIVTGVLATSIGIEGDTIAGWTFASDSIDISLNANLGISENSNNYLSAEDTNSVERVIYLTNGATDNAATTVGWNDGAWSKYWCVKFKAEGFTNIKVSSKQRSGGNEPGPREWKIQARLSHEDWIIVPNGNVTVAGNWTTGVAENLELPELFDNPGSSLIYVRWIMTSDSSTNNTIVDEFGVAKIDDIIISGTSSSETYEILFESKLNIYPNPCSENVMVESSKLIEEISVYNIYGSLIEKQKCNSNSIFYSLPQCKKGIYLISVKYAGDIIPETRKVTVF